MNRYYKKFKEYLIKHRVLSEHAFNVNSEEETGYAYCIIIPFDSMQEVSSVIEMVRTSLISRKKIGWQLGVMKLKKRQYLRYKKEFEAELALRQL